MFRILFTITALTFLSVFSFSQEYCDSLISESFFPLKEGLVKKLKWESTYYVEKVHQETAINGKKYFMLTQTWESGDVDTMYQRIGTDGVYEYHQGTKREFLRMPSDPAINKTWCNYDSTVFYKIVDKAAHLKSKYCDFDSLLVLKVTYKDSKTSFLFYYRYGLGYVGGKTENRINSYYHVPSYRINEKPVRYESCDQKTFSYKDAEECTSSKIFKFLEKTVQIDPVEYRKCKNSSLNVIIYIDKEGKLAKVEELKSTLKSKKVKKKIIEGLKKIPQLKPAQIVDGLYVEDELYFQINF